jgi:hypothetical protein
MNLTTFSRWQFTGSLFFGLTVTGLVSGAQSRLPAKAADPREAIFMRLIYGNHDARTGTSQWLNPPKAAVEALGFGAQKSLVARYGGGFPIVQGGERKVVIWTWSAVAQPFDCHACAPVISATVFAQTEGRWRIEGAEPALGASGGWGRPGQVKIEKVGPDAYALITESGFTGQGETSSLATVYVMQPGGRFKQAANIDTHGDNGGNCDTDKSGSVPYACYDYSATYTFRPNGAQPFYDLVVTTTGTRIGDKGKVISAKGTKVYVYREGEYKAVK